ncbi:MAG: dienelactone hydrolase family protein [Litorimonas sp.]
MCDIFTEQDNETFLKSNGLDRRGFNKTVTIASLAAMLPMTACAQTITEKTVQVTMADGVSDCYYVAPSSGQHPAILMWPDIKGLRPAFKVMGKRMAENGYAVLVVNPFYRDSTAPVAGDNPDFSDPDTRSTLIGMARKLTQDASMSDARAYINFLDAQSEVDTSRKIGTCGYCMGGPLIMRTAAAMPNRVGAAASFHGGGLATERPDSPHLLIPESPAHVLHAIAENDDERFPEAKTILAQAYADANVPAEIEVYAGTKHGWCPPDSTVYDEAQAEKAWSRMLALYKTALV